MERRSCVSFVSMVPPQNQSPLRSRRLPRKNKDGASFKCSRLVQEQLVFILSSSGINGFFGLTQRTFHVTQKCFISKRVHVLFEIQRQGRIFSRRGFQKRHRKLSAFARCLCRLKNGVKLRPVKTNRTSTHPLRLLLPLEKYLCHRTSSRLFTPSRLFVRSLPAGGVLQRVKRRGTCDYSTRPLSNCPSSVKAAICATKRGLKTHSR